MKSSQSSQIQGRVIKSACALCPAGCGIDVHVEGSQIVEITGTRDHPVSHGLLCLKGMSILDYVYSPDRLKHPMKKDETGGWQIISWQEAIDTIAARLTETKQKYGAAAFVLCRGMLGGRQGIISHELIRRFCDLYGSPNAVSVDSMCFRPRIIGHALTFGKLAVADVQNAKCVILWGHNPTSSNPPLGKMILKGIETGTKVIVVDPRRTTLAKKAEFHIQPRPGSDCALALAMLNVIISENLYDKEFVERWTLGFNELKNRVKDYSPEMVEKITWVPSESIKKMARVFASIKPACIVQGGNSLDQNANGVQSARAISILQAITGNLDVPGGFAIMPALRTSHARFPEKTIGKPLGIDKYPLFYKTFERLFDESQVNLFPEAILTGKPYPIKAMMVTLANPAVGWPNSRKTQEALSKLDFLVVMDLFMTETAKLADIVLPAASFLERTDVVDLYRIQHGVPYIMLRKKIIEVDECWSDLKFYSELARRMGYGEWFPWQTEEESIDFLLEPSGLTSKLLLEEKPEGTFYGTIKYKQYETRGFPTPSGKVEFYSDTLAKLGYDPLPSFKESTESHIRNPESAEEYPLTLTTGARTLEYFHSGLRNIGRLRMRVPEPVVDIHPDTAARYGINDGEMIIVATRMGSIEVKVKVTQDIIPNVVNVPHGWSQANANMLIDEKPADPITGCSAYKGSPCRIAVKG